MCDSVWLDLYCVKLWH